jgi:O-antigen/teichoic acid export membrane protein
MASVIDMPSQAISKIASPIISKSWTEENPGEISSIYKKSSIVNQIVGSFIFLGIWVNLEHLFGISSKPEAFIGASSIFLVLGTAKLFDGILGVNSQIIAYSQAYKYNLYFLVFLALISVVTNFLLIPVYGILGAAIATFISLVAFNIIKLIFLKLKYGMQPFSKSTIIVFLLFLATALISMIIPVINNHFFAIIIKSSLILFLFVPGIYFLKVSDDINHALDKYGIERVKRIIKN